MDNSLYLKHYGVKGMKWGVRRARKRDKVRNQEAAYLKSKSDAFAKAAKSQKASSKAHRSEFAKQGTKSKAYQKWRKQEFGNDSDKSIEKIFERTPKQMYKEHLDEYKTSERKAKQYLKAYNNLMSIPADKLPSRRKIRDEATAIAIDINRNKGKGNHTFTRKK